jgi:hypothetical protein
VNAPLVPSAVAVVLERLCSATNETVCEGQN